MPVAVRTCLGVDIGSAWIRVAVMEMAKAGPRVLNLVEEPVQLEAALTEAQRGQKLAKQLVDLLKKNNIRTKSAVFCVPGQSVFVRRRKLPKTSEDRMAQMIRFEARQQIPFPLDQTILQYQVFTEDEDTDAHVLLVAVKRDFINHFMRLVGRTGLKALAISVSSLALYNFHELNTCDRDLSLSAMKKKKKAEPAKPKDAEKKDAGDAGEKPAKKSFFSFGKKKKTAEAAPEAASDATPEGEELALDEEPLFEEIQAYVNMGASLMDLAIPKPGSARMIGFTRSVPLAGNDMDRAVREKLGIEDPDAARQTKETRTAVLSTQFEMDGNPDEVDMGASEAVTAVADRMISELRRSLDYYISQPDGVAVDKLVLSGGLTRLPFLQSYLEERMGLPVELAQPKHEQLRMPDAMPESFAPFAICVGLAAQGLGIAQNSIDFLPEDIKNVRGLREHPLELAAMIVMLVVIIGLSASVGASRIAAYASEVSYYQNQNSNAKTLNKQIEAALNRNTKVKEAYDKLAKAGSERDFWMRFTTLLIEKLPPEILVESVQMRIDGNVVLQGRTPNLASITDFCNAMKQATEFVPAGANNVSTGMLEQVRDPRFTASTVYAFAVVLRTKILSNRIRPLGEQPITPESLAAAAAANAGGQNAPSPFGAPPQGPAGVGGR